MKIYVALIAAAAVCTAGAFTTVEAKEAKKGPKLCAEIKAVDDDTDGELDMAEAKASATKVFKKLDKNNDGKLTSAEFKGRVTASEFKAGNPDNDKTLELPEWLAMTEARFKAANPDGDVTLECDELKSAKGKAFLKLTR